MSVTCAHSDEFLGDCPICLNGIILEEVFCTDFCTHLFHTEWMKKYAWSAIDSNNLPLKWPMCRDKNEITIDSIADLLDKKYVKRYEAINPKPRVRILRRKRGQELLFPLSTFRNRILYWVWIYIAKETTKKG